MDKNSEIYLTTGVGSLWCYFGVNRLLFTMICGKTIFEFSFPWPLISKVLYHNVMRKLNMNFLRRSNWSERKWDRQTNVTKM